MPIECVLDAHALLWFIEDNPKLGDDARTLLADGNNELFVPAIALLEACRALEKAESKIPSQQAFLSAVDGDWRIVIDPVDRDLVGRSTQLTALRELHDRLIVAAALRRVAISPAAVLLSADANIRSSGLVPTRW